MTARPQPSDFRQPLHPLREKAAPRAREKALGAGLTIVAHVAVVAAILLGVQVAKPILTEKDLIADVIPDTEKPAPDVAPPKLAPPPSVDVPPPVITIAPPPSSNAITTTPPRPAPPVEAAPSPAAQPGESRGDYLAGLLAQLNRFKQYPREARAAHIEGVVQVHFVMNRDGKVLLAEIAKSSGRPILDHEALALMDRAQPLPPMPPSMKTDTLDAIVPISFTLH